MERESFVGRTPMGGDSQGVEVMIRWTSLAEVLPGIGNILD